MKLWIARDLDGTLCLYESKPYLDMYNDWDSDDNHFVINNSQFPEITFENSPQEVELKFSATGADRGRRDSIIRGLKQLEKDYMLSYEEEIEWLNCLFPEVTWENSPQEIEFKLVNEIVDITESPLKTFPRVNEFEVGASYRR